MAAPDELTNEQMVTLIKERTYAMQIRVLCTRDQLDTIKDALANVAKDAVFVVRHESGCPNEIDIEEVLEFPYDVKWGKLGDV